MADSPCQAAVEIGSGAKRAAAVAAVARNRSHEVQEWPCGRALLEFTLQDARDRTALVGTLKREP